MVIASWSFALGNKPLQTLSTVVTLLVCAPSKCTSASIVFPKLIAASSLTLQTCELTRSNHLS